MTNSIPNVGQHSSDSSYEDLETSKSWAEEAKAWAISEDLVNDEDYSAKYWAYVAQGASDSGGQNNTASNLGTGEGVYSHKDIFDLQFKSILGSGGTSITSDETTITISSSSTESFSNVGDGIGTYYGLNGSDRQFRSFKGSGGTTVTEASGIITIDSSATETFSTIGTGTAVYDGIVEGDRQFRSLVPTGHITISESNGDISIGNSPQNALETAYDTTKLVPPYGTNTVQTTLDAIITELRSLTAGTTLQGSWDADLNSPDLVTAIPNNGDYWIVSVNGSTDLGGITDWSVGDWALFTGNIWTKVDNSAEPVLAEGVIYDPTLWENLYYGTAPTNVQSALDGILPKLRDTFAMSRANFFAMKQNRIDKAAGNGFIHFGADNDEGDSDNEKVNEGLVCINGKDGSNNEFYNTFSIGAVYDEEFTRGNSITGHAVALIDGIRHDIIGTRTALNRDQLAFITLEDIPQANKRYNPITGVSTTVVDSYGINDAAACIEGAILNGNFRNGSTNWTPSSGVTISGNGIDFSTSTSSGKGASLGAFTGDVPVGEYYLRFHSTGNGVLEFTINPTTGSGNDFQRSFNVVQGNNTMLIPSDSGWSFDGSYNRFGIRDVVGTEYNGIITNISLLPTDEEVIYTRKDLVILESWYEDVRIKDIVYPVGNVQFGNSTLYPGLDNTLVDPEYSAFGDWEGSDAQAGYGIKWSEMSVDERVAFASDDNNNIFIEGDALIQVRYRFRCISGFGNKWQEYHPEWESPYVDRDIDDDQFRLRYDTLNWVSPKGQLITGSDFTTDDSDARGFYYSDYREYQRTGPVGKGAWTASLDASGNRPSGISYNGICNAIPVALIQRRP